MTSPIKKLLRKFSAVLLNIAAHLSPKDDRTVSWLQHRFLIGLKTPGTNNLLLKRVSRSTLQPRDYRRAAIVIQGPIRQQDDFTFQTVMQYATNYPGADVIVSTWDGKDKANILAYGNFPSNVHFVFSSMPLENGHLNLNYQIVAMKAGLQKARELKCELVLRTRSDQRLNAPQLISSLATLVDFFPIKRSERPMAYRPKGRIIGFGVTPYKYLLIPFHISDMFLFGYLEDLEQFFDYADQDYLYKQIISSFAKDGRLANSAVEHDTVRQTYLTRFPPEVLLWTHYASKSWRDCFELNVKNYWDFLRDAAILLSPDDLHFYWPKYAHEWCQNAYGAVQPLDGGSEKYQAQTMGLIEWISLYNGNLRYDASFEEFMDEKYEDYPF